MLCLVLVALATAVQGSLHHISRLRLRQLAESRARIERSVNNLLERPRAYSSAMTLLDTFATVLLVILLSDIALRQHVRGGFWSTLLVAATVLLLCRPALALYDFAARRLVRLVQRPEPAEVEPATEAEFSVLIGGEDGEDFEDLIEEDEREMIDAILHLEDRTARDIMVPRVDIVAVPDTASLAEVVETIERAGHSRVPVYSGSVDNILGVLYAKDLLRFVAGDAAGVRVASLVRPPYIVPESKRVDDLLKELQLKKVHMAIVVDEYGGTAGVVTIEDILEEIVGEIHDEYDVTTAPMLQPVSEREALADGRIAVEEVSDLLDLGWDEEEHGTLGGLVQRELGRLPAEGEVLDYDGVRITVLEVERHRLKRLRIEKLDHATPAPAPAANGAEPTR